MPSNKILLVGPLPEPTTGVSLANRVVSHILRDANYQLSQVNTSFSHFDEDLGSFSFPKLWHNLKYNSQAFKVFYHDTLYITPGQTFFGVLKYGLFILFATLSQKRIITHIHGNHLGNAYNAMNRLQRLCVKFLVSRSSQGIVLSKSLKANLSPFIKQKNIYVLPNFAEDHLTESVIKNYDEVRFIYLSNLMEEKGILFFLKALLVLEEKNISYQAKIAGGVTKAMWIHVQPLLLKLKNVEYLEVVKGEEKKNLLHWANVFVLPTFYTMEGQPISILEAMATGNLIITTRQGGIPDIMEDGVHGYFVEKQNTEDLVRKMAKVALRREIISDIGSANRTYFDTRFTIAIFEKRLLTIFKAR